METAGEGGAWGMALLSAFMDSKCDNLSDWLCENVFAGMKTETVAPEEEGVRGFSEYINRYKRGLCAEKILFTDFS